MWLMILAMFLLSCGPQKRLNRLVKKHPELIRVDTIKLSDTSFLPGTYTDTLISLLSSRVDTIVITKNNIITKLYTHRDSIFISSEALPDTIVKTISAPFTNIVVEEQNNRFEWLKYFGKSLWITLPLLLLLLLIRRRRD